MNNEQRAIIEERADIEYPVLELTVNARSNSSRKKGAFIKGAQFAIDSLGLYSLDDVLRFAEWIAEKDIILWPSKDLPNGNKYQFEMDGKFYKATDLLTQFIEQSKSKV